MRKRRRIGSRTRRAKGKGVLEKNEGAEKNLKFLCCSSDRCLAYSPPPDMNIHNKLFPEEKVTNIKWFILLNLEKSSQRNERCIDLILIVVWSLRN